MERYEEYKDSGVQWMGLIPKEWKTKKGKFTYDIQAGAPFDSNLFSNTGKMPLIRIRDITSGHSDTFYIGEYSEEYVVHDKDFLIGMDGDFNVRWWNDGCGLLNQRCCRVSEHEGSDRKYLYYVLPFYLQSVNDLAYSTTVKHLSNSDILEAVLPFPSLAEQSTIASYLDRKVSHIDSVISEAKASIEEYKAWKASIIYEAVTKGLDPNAEMKVSGVEFIGNIPCEWQVSNLSSLAANIQNGYVGPTRDLFFDEGVKYIQSLHIKDGEILFEKHEYYVKESWAKKHPKIYTGDILIVQTGDIGQVGLVKEEYNGCNCHALIIFTPKKNLIDPLFLTYFLRSSAGKEEILHYKTGALLPHLNAGKIKAAQVSYPTSLEQQQKIASYLDKKCGEIDSLISEKESLISDLEAYKKSLIFEVVTGKRKVC